MSEKIIIYQLLPRLFANKGGARKPWGPIEENGCGKLSDITADTLKWIRYLGVTHVWFTGVIRHASCTVYPKKYGIPRQHPEVVKGKAGSPYAITDYYDVDPDLAVRPEQRMQEWEALIERTHKAGMKVVMDFVPNHVAREYKSVCHPYGVHDLGADDDQSKHFSPQNNFYYCWDQPLDLSDIDPKAKYKETPARATGNDHFDNHPGRSDWYETVKLNYGIDYCDAGGRSEHFDPMPDTWKKMTDILLFWASKGIDAFRCDMAEMVPTAFWHHAIDTVHSLYPHIDFIGEVYNPALYRDYIAAGFTYLYDKVGMYDCLRDVVCHRRSAQEISQQWQSTDDIASHMLYFLENHDEQRIASDFFAGSARRGLPAHLVACLLRSNPYMLYSGQELGERGMDEEGFSGCDGRTTIFDYWSLPTLQHGFYNRRKRSQEEKDLTIEYQKVMLIATREKAATGGEMFDLMYANPQLQQQFAFLRHQGKETLLVVANFSDESHDIPLVIPRHAFDYLGLKEGPTKSTDLLTGEAVGLDLKADAVFRLQLPANGGVVLKWK